MATLVYRVFTAAASLAAVTFCSATLWDLHVRPGPQGEFASARSLRALSDRALAALHETRAVRHSSERDQLRASATRMLSVHQEADPRRVALIRSRVASLEARAIIALALEDLVDVQHVVVREATLAKAKAVIVNPEAPPLDRAQAYRFLGEIGATIPDLGRAVKEQWIEDVFLQSGDELVARHIAISMLGMELDVDMLGASTVLLRHPDAAVRKCVLEALERRGNEGDAWLPAFLGECRRMMIEDESQRVRAMAQDIVKNRGNGR